MRKFNEPLSDDELLFLASQEQARNQQRIAQQALSDIMQQQQMQNMQNTQQMLLMQHMALMHRLE